jgi:hypothetical protein
MDAKGTPKIGSHIASPDIERVPGDFDRSRPRGGVNLVPDPVGKIRKESVPAGVGLRCARSPGESARQ